MKRIAKRLCRAALDRLMKRRVFRTPMQRLARAVLGGETAPARDPALEAMLRFLVYETSSLRRLVRYAIADNPCYRSMIEQTASSFNCQWVSLPENEHLLSNPAFRATVPDLVCKYTGLDASWFPGKRVLDAGCGNGRFSWALAKLGADVTAFDLSVNGTANLRRECAAAGLSVRVFQHNVLEPLPLEGPFDLVWSYGVLHHTGNTFRGFQNIQPLVGQGGYLFLMLYGEPRLGVVSDFEELNAYERLRRATRNRSFPEVIAFLEKEVASNIHGWFDAVSPTINDIYTFEEIEEWLLWAGFTDVRKTLDSRNHHVVARRAAGAGRSAGTAAAA
jgi:2-polyprenyl-3-methyl-5-hydroxy-6-metoxy-1,4-benzoquinol methylase